MQAYLSYSAMLVFISANESASAIAHHLIRSPTWFGALAFDLAGNRSLGAGQARAATANSIAIEASDQEV
jgi:hypothetical protein